MLKYPPKLWNPRLASLVQWCLAIDVCGVAVSSSANENPHCLQQPIGEGWTDCKMKRCLTIHRACLNVRAGLQQCSHRSGTPANRREMQWCPLLGARRFQW
jgi:hypothetical protein